MSFIQNHTEILEPEQVAEVVVEFLSPIFVVQFLAGYLLECFLRWVCIGNLVVACNAVQLTHTTQTRA